MDWVTQNAKLLTKWKTRNLDQDSSLTVKSSTTTFLSLQSCTLPEIKSDIFGGL